jgi:GntR family transcriptional regulator/MocR family aminotransferase
MRELGWPSAMPTIDRESIVPIYQQIYEELREAILTGTLPESTRLPPERTLAEKLSVNRSTVVHAYRELVVDGLIEQRVGSGSRVARSTGQQSKAADVPWWITLPPWRVGSFPQVLGELAATAQADRISFVQGVPPFEPSPLDELAKSFARAAGDPNYVLSYGNSEGHTPLREAIAMRMRARLHGRAARSPRTDRVDPRNHARGGFARGAGRRNHRGAADLSGRPANISDCWTARDSGCRRR